MTCAVCDAVRKMGHEPDAIWVAAFLLGYGRGLRRLTLDSLPSDAFCAEHRDALLVAASVGMRSAPS